MIRLLGLDFVGFVAVSGAVGVISGVGTGMVFSAGSCVPCRGNSCGIQAVELTPRCSAIVAAAGRVEARGKGDSTGYPGYRGYPRYP